MIKQGLQQQKHTNVGSRRAWLIARQGKDTLTWVTASPELEQSHHLEAPSLGSQASTLELGLKPYGLKARVTLVLTTTIAVAVLLVNSLSLLNAGFDLTTPPALLTILLVFVAARLLNSAGSLAWGLFVTLALLKSSLGYVSLSWLTDPTPTNYPTQRAPGIGLFSRVAPSGTTIVHGAFVAVAALPS